MDTLKNTTSRSIARTKLYDALERLEKLDAALPTPTEKQVAILEGRIEVLMELLGEQDRGYVEATYKLNKRLSNQ